MFGDPLPLGFVPIIPAGQVPAAAGAPAYSIRPTMNGGPPAVIEMVLPVASDWTVSIYNVAGQKVYAASGRGQAGVHRIEWNGAAQASGVYFYRVDAGRFTATRKMVLVR